MELNEILAIRLAALMASRPALDTQIKLHQATGLAQASIQRVLARKVHTGLDVLQKLADAFGVPPTSLIEPIEAGRDIEQIPASIEEIAVLQQWRRLDELEKHTVMGYLGLVSATKSRALSVKRRTVIDDDISPDNMTAAHNRAADRPIEKTQGNESNVKSETRGGQKKRNHT